MIIKCRNRNAMLWRNEFLKAFGIFTMIGRSGHKHFRGRHSIHVTQYTRCLSYIKNKLREVLWFWWQNISLWHTCNSSSGIHCNLQVITSLMEYVIVIIPLDKRKVLRTSHKTLSSLISPPPSPLSLSSSSFRSSHYDPIHLSTASCTVGCNGECDAGNFIVEK